MSRTITKKYKQNIDIKLTEKLAIVGMSPTTREKAPFDNKEYTIWCMNEMGNINIEQYSFIKRIDLLFQIHSKENFSREGNKNDPNHFEWLKAHGGYPIMMQQKFSDIQSSIEYPLQEVIDLIGSTYITSTFSFMMGLAILYHSKNPEVFKIIETFGFDMGSETEYMRQRSCAEFFIGFAKGRGIQVITHSDNLLRAPLYGYDEEKTAIRQQFEMRRQLLAIELKQEENAIAATQGVMAAYQETEKNDPSADKEKIKKDLEMQERELLKHRMIAEQIKGAIMEASNSMRLIDSMPYNIKK